MQFRFPRQRIPIQVTSKMLLALLAIIGMCGSAAYWWGIQSALTENKLVAAAYTAIMVLAPPSLVSFLIPWSPAGMLLQKVNLRTVGYTVVIGCSLFLLYYSYYIQTAWWAAQPVVQDANLVNQQMLIGIIGFIIIPALLWTPVSSDELVEQVRQSHLVKRYELQTQADIAILRATLLRSQQLAIKGFANLATEEREELAEAMHGLLASLDGTLKEISDAVKTVSGVALPFDDLIDGNADIRGVLEYISDSLVETPLLDQPAQTHEEHIARLAQEHPWEGELTRDEAKALHRAGLLVQVRGSTAEGRVRCRVSRRDGYEQALPQEPAAYAYGREEEDAE